VIVWEAQMRNAVILAVFVLAASATSGSAASLDIEDWYAKVQSLTQSLLSVHRPDHEIIAAPQDLDRQMALVPPRNGSRMPLIAPPADPSPRDLPLQLSDRK